MDSRELGPYVLLRKLSQSALLEIYRAGEREGQEVQRVVLLCFFNVDQEDAAWLAGTAQAGRRALKGLDANSLASAIDSGEIEGTPYLAYDYVSGGDLHTLIQRTRTHGTPVSLGHALLITDRVAQALLAAWEHESRALHGFLVPQLVMLSTEGDVQLLGIEVASRLRKLLTDSAIKREMGSYLGPEVVPEGQPSTIDDVFSLGALLFELVTGRTLPQSSPEDLTAAIGEARLTDGSELPDFLVDLLESSLAPGPKRSTLKAWQAAIDAEVISGKHQASAFDLALFLHTVFSEELRADDLPEPSDDPIELLQPALDRLDALEAGLGGSEIQAPPEMNTEVAMEVEAQPETDEPAASEPEADAEPEPELEAEPGIETEPEANSDAELAIETEPDAQDGPEAGSEPEDELAAVESAEVVPEPWEVEPPAPSSRRPLTIGAVVVLLALVGFAGFKFFGPTTDPATRLADATPPAVQALGENLQPATMTPGDSASDPEVDESTEQPTQEPTTAPSETPASRPADLNQQSGAPVSGEVTTPPAGAGSEAVSALPEATPAVSTDSLDPTESSSQPVDDSTLNATAPAPSTVTVDPEPAAVVDQTTNEAPEESSETQSDLGLNVATSTDTGESISEEPTGNSASEPRDADSAMTQPADRSLSDSIPPEGTEAPEAFTRPAPEPVQATSELPEPVEPQPQQAQPQPTISEPEPEEAPAPLEPPVVEGDLVESGPGVVAPSITKTVEPVYPMRARRLKKSATVSVRVLVSETGQVLEVERLGDEAGDGFDQAAIDAARKSAWEPATKDGVPVKMWRTVSIRFEP
jgi:TonB family protein